MALPPGFIQELLARTDIVTVVERYVPLRKGGANLMGLCPFHAEKSPSFTVSPAKQFFHCFGCGKHGDAIAFLMEHTGASFVDAVSDLAQQQGMALPEDDATPADRARASAQRERRLGLHDVLDKALAAYRQQLKGSARAIEYFRNRGVSGEVARDYGLGYAPAGWRHLASVFARYDDPLLVESGLVIEQGEEGSDEHKRYDRFRDRVMFPIRDPRGQCIGFGGRVLGDDKPKYLNSPETPVFSKGRELYGLWEGRSAIRDAGYCLVTEGYMDVVALAQFGFGNAVATLGTACTEDHVRKLFRSTDTVVFSFDGDAAGRRAARKALEVALPHATDLRTVKFLFLPPEHDPDSYIRAHGKEAFAHCVTEATPLSRFLLDSLREGCDLANPEGRAHLAAAAKPLWSLLPEGALKLQMLAELATLAQFSPDSLRQLWVHAQQGRTPRPASVSAAFADDEWAAPDRPDAPPGWLAPSRRSGAGRPKVPQRADRAVCLLLTHPRMWTTLGSEDHELLCALPAPHGPLIAWLESRLLEAGEQSWEQLRSALQGQPLEAAATALLGATPDLQTPEVEAGEELRDVLARMQIDSLKELETQAIRQSRADPAELQRYRELQARRQALQTALGKNG